ncbi:MAG: hypothetical protein ACKPKO_27700 [Candidatus Fonsibacter sp.]
MVMHIHMVILMLQVIYQLQNIYNKNQVDNLLSGKQNTITSSTDLTITKLIHRPLEPPTGFTDVQIKADQVYFGNPVWLTGTSISVNFWGSCIC